MPQSPLRLIKHCHEYLGQGQISDVPPRTRGIYVLYQLRPPGKSPKAKSKKTKDKYDVVYVGLAKAGRQSGIRGRLMAHRRRKAKLWSHFSFFEAWDNIRDEEIAELEGLFRHIYRDDPHANALNVQKGFRPLKLLNKAAKKAAKVVAK